MAIVRGTRIGSCGITAHPGEGGAGASGVRYQGCGVTPKGLSVVRADVTSGPGDGVTVRRVSGRMIVVSLVLLGTLACGRNQAGPSVADPAGPPASAAVRIMPLGDSITQGEHVEQGYRRGLWLKLNAAGFDVDFVGSLDTPHMGPGSGDYDQDHEGHWGWTADRILASISGWAAQADPHMVGCRRAYGRIYGLPRRRTL